jgi:DNA-binding transcriptional MocR family regulator
MMLNIVSSSAFAMELNMNNKNATLYRQVAQNLALDIEQGVYLAEQKIPSVRKLSKQLKVSISTVNQAYALLEDQGLIRAKPQAGYFVRQGANDEPVPPPISKGGQPKAVTKIDLINHVLDNVNKKSSVDLGCAIPDYSFMPYRSLQTHLQKVTRFNMEEAFNYQFSPGLESLRAQIALRMRDVGLRCHADDIVITQGCSEALHLCLSSVTQRGDIIAVESPCYYGFLQMANLRGLKVIEIPTDPSFGISIDALKLALAQWPIKAITVTSRYSNPTGASISCEKQKQLVSLARQFDCHIIEDDIYGEIPLEQPSLSMAHHKEPINTVIKTHDTDDRVMYCSSYSKTVGPGLRIGWCIPGRNKQNVIQAQRFSTMAASSLPQLAMTSYLQNGHYDKHLRNLRQIVTANIKLFSQVIQHNFPSGTRLSVPAGGFILWVCLPEGVSSIALLHLAQAESISIIPGEIFSNSDHFRNYIRLNCAIPWNDDVNQALVRLSELIRKLMSN